MASHEHGTDREGHPARHDSGVQEYFDRYARALMAGDGRTIAAMWEAPALVIDDENVIAVSATEQVEAFFTGARDQYQARGITATRAEILRLQWATERIVVVDVRWPQLDAEGEERGDELSTYTLRRGGDGELKVRAVLMRGGNPR